jgi:hypothetical protein
MGRHHSLQLAGIAACILVLSASPQPTAAGPLDDPTAQPPSACDNAVQALQTLTRDGDAARGSRGALEARDLGSAGPTQLCLVYHPTLEAYSAFIFPVATADAFRAAKTMAVARLPAAGVDVCRVGMWMGLGPPGSPPLDLDDYDRLELPARCAPRVVAGDEGATRLLPQVRDALDRAASVTAREMEWQQNRALTLIVYADPEAAAVPVGLLHHDALPQTLAARARSGEATTLRGPFGHLVRFPMYAAGGTASRPASYLDAGLVHELTHFAQLAHAAPDSIPYWFLEGQAEYMEARAADRAEAALALAVLAQRAGRAVALADLTRADQWHGQAQGPSRGEVFGRAYAALLFLAERHGFPATVQLLRDTGSGTHEQFYTHLSRLAGMDLPAFERALDAWLEARGADLAASP